MAEGKLGDCDCVTAKVRIRPVRCILMKSFPLVCAALGSLLLLAAPLFAQVPQLINYQGRIAVGTVNFQGSGAFKFALVNAAGTTTYWSNDGTSAAGAQPASGVVLTVTKGLYSVLLGDTSLSGMPMAIPATVWTNADVRLRVWFNDGTSGWQLLTPDQRLAPNGYLSDGSVAAATIADGAITSPKLANGAITSPKLASGAVTNAQLADGSITSAKIAAGTTLGDQSVAGTAQTAAANTSYLASNAAATTFTLPATANVGDVINVSGAGGGGWSAAFNGPWLPRESLREWRALASSADGSKLVAVVQNGLIYTSTDSGVSWTPRESSRTWLAAASSADGSKLAAVVLGGQIYTSADSGVSWTPRESSRPWRSVASSADGSKLVAVADESQIFTSTNSGVSWTPRENFREWIAVASSADGAKLVALDQFARIYTSTDSGVSWTQRESNRNWRAVASSSDGAKLVAAEYGGQLYTSTDSGVTWTAREINRVWTAVASSADGSKLAAVEYGGVIYGSTDSGVSWTPRESGRQWQAVASSSDGSKLAAAGSSTQIYTALNGLSGAQGESVSLVYLGNGQWQPVNQGWTVNGGNIYRNSGRVGIGTLNPACPLDVIGASDIASSGDIYVRYITSNNWAVEGPNIASVSIRGAAYVSAIGYISISDARMKNIVGRSAGAADLQTLLGLEITDYRFKDAVAKGSTPQKKVIAQQVEKIFPQAVSQGTDVVPDIFKKATIKDGWVMLATDLKKGDRVKLIGAQAQGIHEVSEVEARRFRTGFPSADGEVFVYGREVKDFRQVDYEAIAMLNVSATQELARRVQAQEEENSALKKQVAALAAKLELVTAAPPKARARTAKLAVRK